MSKKEQVSNEEVVLDALLSVEDRPEKDVYMKRFGVNFRIRALDGDTINKLQSRCTHYTGKGKNREKVTDEEKLGALMIKEACLIPDFGDKKLLDRYGVKQPEEVVRKRLLAGEINKLANEIFDISGFEEEEDDIKN